MCGSDFQEGSGKNAHHVVEEAAPRHTEGDEPRKAAALLTLGREFRAVYAPHRVRGCRAACAEGREIVLSEEKGQCGPHRL